jgi:hypothetical protein
MSIIQSLDSIPNFSKGEKLVLGRRGKLRIRYPEIENASTERGKIIHDSLFPKNDPYLLSKKLIDRYEGIVALSDRELIEKYDEDKEWFLEFQRQLVEEKNVRDNIVENINMLLEKLLQISHLPEPNGGGFGSPVYSFWCRIQREGRSSWDRYYNIEQLNEIKKWLKAKKETQ